jgi:hypothetical protein
MAATARPYLDEAAAVWLLFTVVDCIRLRAYYTPGLAASQADPRVSRDLIAERLPKTSASSALHDIDLEPVTLNWSVRLAVHPPARPPFCSFVEGLSLTRAAHRLLTIFVNSAEKEDLGTLEQEEVPHAQHGRCGRRIRVPSGAPSRHWLDQRQAGAPAHSPTRSPAPGPQ